MSLTFDKVDSLIQMHLAIGATHTLLQRILGVHTIVTELGGILVRKCGLRAQQLRGIQQMHLVLQSTRESFFINNTKIYFCLYYDYFYLLQDSHVIDLKIICTEKKMKVLYFFYIYLYIFFFGWLQVAFSWLHKMLLNRRLVEPHIFIDRRTKRQTS